MGQHGLGYLELNEKKYNIEYKTSDKFFSWGNFNFDKKIFKKLYMRQRKNSKVRAYDNPNPPENQPYL